MLAGMGRKYVFKVIPVGLKVKTRSNYPLDGSFLINSHLVAICKRKSASKGLILDFDLDNLSTQIFITKGVNQSAKGEIINLNLS